ncbi:MAG TPA: Do family serine endopeptidase, partial [Steroidobacteraceae bacterium]|nr:Do family serine endopeptidase [Steroidobacteraceae bacterium]
STALALVAGGWGLSHVEWAGIAHAKPEDNPAAAAVPRGAAGIPDFTALVKSQGQAVVNVQVERSGEDDAQAAVPPNQFGPLPFPFEAPPGPGGRPGPGAPNQMPRQAQGSGFIISPDGYILSNAHVVSGGGDVTVKLTDKREFKAKVVGVDTRTDVAVLKIDATDLPHVKLGNPADVQVGEWVAAIGSPFGFENTVTSGIVSGTSRSLPEGSYVPFIQTDVAVNPGNSGGPLFNLNGEVVGINSQIYSRTGGYMGVSFAIPIDVATGVKDQLIKSGHVTRSRIGVSIQDVTAQLAESFGLDRPRGALVGMVEDDSPGAKGGIKAGDVILKVDGETVETSSQVPVMIAGKKPGSSVALEVWRNGSSKELTVRPVEIQEKGQRVASNDSEQSDETAKLGLAVRPLTQQEKRQAETDGDLLVEDVDGPAAGAGVRPGDIILGVNGAKVKSIDELRAAAKKRNGKVVALLIERDNAQIFVPVRVG